jgi:hypothetical protein
MKPKGPILTGLAQLSDAIQQAENFLRTIPSSMSGKCNKSFKYNNIGYCLYYSNKKLKLADDEELVGDLSGFPSGTRIEASKYIPDLIDLALDLEPQIEIEATKVAKAINDKIKQHLES